MKNTTDSSCSTTFLSQQNNSVDNYQEVALIGSGAYGTVYKARCTSSETIVALKKVKVPLNEEGVPMSLLREVSLLKQLERWDHPHVVK